MPELTVIAFDPGETTGWCVMTVEKVKYLTCTEYRLDDTALCEFRTGQIDCRMENFGVESMLDLTADYPGCPVVHEDFIVDFNQITKHRSALSPVRITAKFEFGLWLSDEAAEGRFFVQNRSPVKTTCTDDRLKNWGLYDRNSGRHARDAVRHAFYFLRTCRGSGTAAAENRWKAWPHVFVDPCAVEVVHKRTRQVGERIQGLK